MCRNACFTHPVHCWMQRALQCMHSVSLEETWCPCRKLELSLSAILLIFRGRSAHHEFSLSTSSALPSVMSINSLHNWFGSEVIHHEGKSISFIMWEMSQVESTKCHAGKKMNQPGNCIWTRNVTVHVYILHKAVTIQKQQIYYHYTSDILMTLYW